MRLGRVYITPAFLVGSALVYWLDTQGVFPVFLLAAAIHEGGHLAAMALLGRHNIANLSLVMDLFSVELSCGYMPPVKEAICVLAGPLANIICFLLVLFLSPPYQWLKILGGMSLALGLFNMLPICFLDGGRLAALATEPLSLGDGPSFALSLATAAALAGGALVLCYGTGAGYGVLAAALALLLRHAGHRL